MERANATLFVVQSTAIQLHLVAPYTEPCARLSHVVRFRLFIRVCVYLCVIVCRAVCSGFSTSLISSAVGGKCAVGSCGGIDTKKPNGNERAKK